jgi:hypothetical protein
VVLPALAALTMLCVWSVAAVAMHVQCLDAARTGARALARDEPVAAVQAVVEQRAPGGAQVRVRDLGDGLVAVEVRARVPVPGPWSSAPGVTVGGSAVAEAEAEP